MFKVTLANWTRWIVFARSVHYAVPLFAPKETNVRCVNVFRRRGLLRYLYPLLAPARTFRRQRGGGGERETVSSSRVNPFVGIARLITKTRVAGNLRELCGRCFIEIPEISFSRFEYRGTLFVNWTTGVELTGVHPRIITFYFISRKGDLETLLLLIDKKRNRPV